MNNLFQKSKYTCQVQRQDGTAVYHSLKGGLCIVGNEFVKVLESFTFPQSISEAIVTNSYLSEQNVRMITNVLLAKGFIIPFGYNEYGKLREKIESVESNLKYGSQVNIVQLIISNECNFKCTYCFINKIYSSKKRFTIQNLPDNKHMSFELARDSLTKIIELIKANNKSNLSVQFFGGEPLINWKTIKTILEFFKKGDEYGINIDYSIVTNGSLINEEIANYFSKNKVSVIISLDSSKQNSNADDKIKNSNKKILKNLEILKKYNNSVILNSALSNETFDSFDNSIIDIALAYGIKEIGIILDLDISFYEKNKSEIADKLISAYLYGHSKGVVITGYWHTIFQRMLLHDHLDYYSYKTCSATGCQLSIEPSGDVFACKGSSGYFGNIDDINTLLSSSTYSNYATRNIKNSTICDSCEIENFCSGLCLGPLEKKYNTINTVDLKSCEVYKEITKKLIMNVDKKSFENYAVV